MKTQTQPLPVFIVMCFVVLLSKAVHAQPSAFFTRMLDSIKSIQAGEHLSPPEISFATSGANVVADDVLTLTWRSRYASDCMAEGGWQGARALTGSEQITVTELGPQQYSLHCTGDKGATVSTVDVNVIAQNIDAWSGTKIPSYLPPSPTDFELFDNSDGLSIAGGPEGLWHENTESPGAGKFIFIRVHQAARHGLEWGEQFGWFGSWLSSFGVNSIEGGL